MRHFISNIEVQNWKKGRKNSEKDKRTLCMYVRKLALMTHGQSDSWRYQVSYVIPNRVTVFLMKFVALLMLWETEDLATAETRGMSARKKLVGG